MRLIPVILSLLYCSIAFGQFGPDKVISRSNTFPFKSQSFDLDGDGDLDVLVASNFYGPKIVWYENLGGGVFGVQQVISTESEDIKDVSAADIDGDLDLDIVSASSNDGKIAWYENLGGGNFGSQNTIFQGGLPLCVYPVDIDSDGDIDVMGGFATYDMIICFENSGGGVFSSSDTITALTDNPLSLYAEDIDNDLDLDLVSASTLDSKIAWYENLGGGINFGAQQVISTSVNNPNSVFIQDMNNDGDRDVVYGSMSDSKIAWNENLGLGTFGIQQVINLGDAQNVTSIHLADLDGDLDYDVLSSSDGDEEISCYENLGGGVFGAQQIISDSAHDAKHVITGDFDNDGDQDVLATSSGDDNIIWHENDGTSNFINPHQISVTMSDISSAIAIDVDLDGDKDIICSGLHKIVWYENFGDGTYSEQKIVADRIDRASGLYAADIDSDGDLDVLCASWYGNEIFWIENTGGGTFGALQVISNIVSSPRSTFAADFDLDGDMDVASASAVDDKIAWYENLGGGTFGSQQIVTTSANGAVMVFGADLDMDGDIDLLSASMQDDKIAWYENLGGSFGGQQLISNLADGAVSVYADDYDNDGDIDVLSASNTDDKIAWYENQGGGSFGGQQIIALANNPRFAISGDINEDGLSDLFAIYSNGLDFELGWYENMGGGIFSSVNSILTEEGITAIELQDLDNDGDNDIITSSFDDDLLVFDNYFYHTSQIKGRVFVDINNNGQHDSLDVGFGTVPIVSSPSSNYSFTFQNGYFFMNMGSAPGVYQVAPSPLWNWILTTDSSSYIVLVDSTFISMDSLDFGYTPDSIITELGIELTDVFPRCDDTVNIAIDIRNLGTTIPSGVIHLQLHDSLTYVSCATPPDSIIGQNIYWYLDSLSYFSYYQLNFLVKIPNFLSVGNTYTSYASIYVRDSLNNLIFANTDSLNQLIRCSYDPNDKMALPLGVDSMGYIPHSANSIEYKIRFQNTGNDTARTVVIRDQLDSNFNWQSLVPLAYSHPMTISIGQGGEIEFRFANIMLPDSGADYLGSQGFVKFRVDLRSGLSLGTSIFNKAGIYFDYNPPVITNTTIHTLYDCENISFGSLFGSINCFNDSIKAQVNDSISGTVIDWDIPGVFNFQGSSFSWMADTVGTFNLNVSSNNLLCQKDTVLILNINPIYESTSFQSICQGDSVLIFGLYQNSAGIYSDTLQTVFGCDSILSENLSVDSSFLNNQNIDICFGDSLNVFGTYQSSSGVYYDSLQTSKGCDSIMIITLNVNSLPSVSLASFSPDSICQYDLPFNLSGGLPAGGTYSGDSVSGNLFNPSTPGQYYITYFYSDTNGCVSSDSSLISFYLCTGVIDNEVDPIITVFPNPVKDRISIRANGAISEVHLRDVTGRQYEVQLLNNELDANSLNNGVYFLVVRTKNTERIFKIVVQH